MAKFYNNFCTMSKASAGALPSLPPPEKDKKKRSPSNIKVVKKMAKKRKGARIYPRYNAIVEDYLQQVWVSCTGSLMERWWI